MTDRLRIRVCFGVKLICPAQGPEIDRCDDPPSPTGYASKPAEFVARLNHGLVLSPVSELSEFVLARIADEEEAFLRMAAPSSDDLERDVWVIDSSSDSGVRLAIGYGRLRVELEAKRRLLDWAEKNGHDLALQCLALAYDTHCDWQTSWALPVWRES